METLSSLYVIQPDEYLKEAREIQNQTVAASRVLQLKGNEYYQGPGDPGRVLGVSEEPSPTCPLNQPCKDWIRQASGSCLNFDS